MSASKKIELIPDQKSKSKEFFKTPEEYARESCFPLYVAGRRVNLLLASFGCAPDCTRRPAPGILLLGFCARRIFTVKI
jgi:hypothetical protein